MSGTRNTVIQTLSYSFCIELSRCPSMAPDATAYSDSQVDMVSWTWNRLVAIENWQLWMQGVDNVTQLDEGELARGSHLILKQGSSRKDCHISYWEPPKRIEFVVSSSSRRMGYSFNLGEAIDGMPSTLQLDVEFEYRYWYRLIAPWLARRARRDCVRTLDGFRRYISN